MLKGLMWIGRDKNKARTFWDWKMRKDENNEFFKIAIGLSSLFYGIKKWYDAVVDHLTLQTHF